METTKPKTNLLGSTSSAETKLSIDFVTADQIGISYNTLPGNQPKTYGNFVAIWQNQNQIPFAQPPLKIQAVDTNTQAGSMSFQGLDVNNNSYIIGYSVGPALEPPHQTYGNICSTAFIPNSGTVASQTDFASNLVLVNVGTNSVAFQYNVPSGILPLTNGAWCGIWRSSVASYNNPPDATIPVTIDADSGTLAFNNFTIGRGLTYTIALFMSGWQGFGQPNNQHAMACTLTFTNA